LSIEKSTNMVDWTDFTTTATVDSATLLELTSTLAITKYPCFLRIKASD
jgi:hypothetical protein